MKHTRKEWTGKTPGQVEYSHRDSEETKGGKKNVCVVCGWMFVCVCVRVVQSFPGQYASFQLNKKRRDWRASFGGKGRKEHNILSQK